MFSVLLIPQIPLCKTLIACLPAHTWISTLGLLKPNPSSHFAGELTARVWSLNGIPDALDAGPSAHMEHLSKQPSPSRRKIHFKTESRQKQGSVPLAGATGVWESKHPGEQIREITTLVKLDLKWQLEGAAANSLSLPLLEELSKDRRGNRPACSLPGWEYSPVLYESGS